MKKAQQAKFDLLYREVVPVLQPTLDALLGEIEKGYLPNPYHNATHAADVAYTTHVMLHHGVKQALDLTDMQCAVCVLAARCALPAKRAPQSRVAPLRH